MMLWAGSDTREVELGHMADLREDFQAGMRRMREAFAMLRQGEVKPEQANDEFFEGYSQVKKTFGAALLHREIREARHDPPDPVTL
jgi:hypothetical protein